MARRSRVETPETASRETAEHKEELQMEFVHTLKSGKTVLFGRTTRLLSGKYAVETRTIKGEFQLNMNIPMFNTENEARDYLLSQPNWREAAT